MPSYDIPEEVKVSQEVAALPGLLSDRIFRVIWVSISIGHIRDQHFWGHVENLVERLKKEDNFPALPDFLHIVKYSGIGRQYGLKSIRSRYGGESRVFDLSWWSKVWEILYYKRDIKLVLKEQEDGKV